MSIKKNAFANYIGQIYIAAVNVLIVPFYLDKLGVEAYGLIGFFAVMLTWLQILDMGVSHTLLRESAKFKADSIKNFHFPYALKFLNKLFLFSAFLFIILGVSSSLWISKNWLNARTLPFEDVLIAVIVMIFTTAIKWRTIPYRSVIIGFEHQIWINVVNVVSMSLRTIGAICLVGYTSNPVVSFFIFQLLVSVIEAIFLIFKVKKLVPSGYDSVSIFRTNDERKAIIYPIIKFSLGVACSSGLWVIITQMDRLALSKVLSLSDYGAFSLVVTLSTGILLLSSPITQAVVPKMTALKSSIENKEHLLFDLYHSTTQAISVMIAPLSIIMSLFSYELLWAWTSNTELSNKISGVLPLYALGYGIQSVCSVLYYIQYVKGNLFFHAKGLIIFSIILIPSVWWVASIYGMNGTGYLWLTFSLFYLFVWSYFVKRKFAKGHYAKWIFRDILLIWLVALIISLLASELPLPWNENRWLNLLFLCSIGIISVSLCALLHSKILIKLNNTRKSGIKHQIENGFKIFRK
jgi:O-antigen/teichoic acid export membrane protein